MKRLTFLLIALLFVFNAYSAFLRNVPIDLKQPDGTLIHCLTSGDEFYSWLHDSEDYINVHGEDGYYYYGLEVDGLAKPSRDGVQSDTGPTGISIIMCKGPWL